MSKPRPNMRYEDLPPPEVYQLPWPPPTKLPWMLVGFALLGWIGLCVGIVWGLMEVGLWMFRL